MIKRLLFAAAALALSAGAAHAGNTVNVTYFEIPDAGAGPDFNVCCSSGPATLPDIAIGSSLVGGLPVTMNPEPSAPAVADQSGIGQILWWTPPTVTPNGSGVLTLPFGNPGQVSNMFASNGGGNDATFYETAIVSGDIVGTGADTTFTVASDDDALVYLNGKYVGGNPGVHGVETTTIDLGALTGNNALEVFYADRAQTGAYLGLDISGATISAVPEPAAWALMILGVGAMGGALQLARRRDNGIAFTAS